ncbi:MAG: ATP-binding protein [bacterium]
MNVTEAVLRRWLTDPEGERLELKSTLLSRKEIAEYAVAIGNEGGGWLVMGVTNRPPRRVVGVDPPSAAQSQTIQNSVLDATGIRVEIGQIATEEGTVVAIRIPGRPRGQVFSTRSGKYLMRAGETLRGMTLAEIDRLRAGELARPDFTAESLDLDWREALDPVELSRLRQFLRDQADRGSGRRELAGLKDPELLRALELVVTSGRRTRLVRAAVLIVGTRAAIREAIPNHEVKILRFGRDDLTPDLTEDTRAPLLAVAQRAEEIVEAVNTVESYQAGLFRVDIPKFPPAAYREAIANALIHRDYQQSGNVAVRVYRDRLEVGSPGGWFGTINESNILVTESQRRNERLAEALQKIGLAERAALGVRRMFTAMLRAGKLPPSYRSTARTVTVTLVDGSFDREFVALARRLGERGEDLSVFDLLLLSHVRRHREITVKDAAVLCQRSDTEARRLLDDLRNQELLERVGEGRGRKYVLGPVAYEDLGLTGQRPRDLGLSEKTFEGLLIDELERKGTKGLTAREIREWSRHGKAQTTRLLQSLQRRGVIAASGKRGLGSRYWLIKHAPAGVPIRQNHA